jgi:metallo-beta-lactamase family protein
MPTLTFYGAAETVTGSKYLLESDQARILVDCGLFQGLKELRLKNWAELPFRAASIDAVVLTHAHLDHIGFLPRLVKQGFQRSIYCTPATAELARIILLDAAKIQVSDAEYANRKGISKHHPALPLFDVHDAQQAIRRLVTIPLDKWFTPAAGIDCRFHDAGHLLGSAMIETKVENRGQPPLTILFSGDVGRFEAPLYHDPTPPPACDYLICESTYGDREHPRVNVLEQLARTVNEAVHRGGVILVAAFAIGRAQQLIYLLELLAKQGKTPELPIYLDSPMAVEATEVYCRHAADHDLSEGTLTAGVFDGPNVHLARTVDESKRINHVGGPAVIIASSGMMTGGRILFHLRQRLPDPRNTVLLGGFMADGTRGRKLLENAPTLRIHGQDVPARAAISNHPELSGHADRGELLRWLAPLAAPQAVFVTHGEKASALAFAEELRARRGWNARAPYLGETVQLELPGP